VARPFIIVALSTLALAGLFLALRPEIPSGGAPEQRSFKLEIRNGSMTPDELVVREGDRVTLRIESDRPVELHVHGYDLRADVAPGETAEISFDADFSGRFEIENHHDHSNGDEHSHSATGTLVVQPR
jgi:heme/copper-type cytochrome/quinol oxidase subunit 2